ncbi:hypothetical protein [Streptomyces sp. IBSBF 3136]|uniref:hypothetical protein n=1 Tax=Streptomyces sp. IBSBF 3136 TaxID=2903524 RepID=UPI002FDC77A3
MHLNNDTVPVVIKAHRVVIERLALEPPVWPFRAFDGPRGFGSYWRDNDMSGSWKARRDCVEAILGPTRDALEELQELECESRFRNGPAGSFKNLIFAADGEKPEMVLRDAVKQRRGDRPQRAHLPGVHRSAAAAGSHLAADGRLMDEEPPAGHRREDRRERPVPAPVPVAGLRARAAGDADVLRPLAASICPR